MRRGGRSRSAHRPREERPQPVSAEREPERAPEPEETPAGAPAGDDSYFRIPESIGIVASPNRKEQGEQTDEETPNPNGQPITFGRRPRAGGRRRR